MDVKSQCGLHFTAVFYLLRILMKSAAVGELDVDPVTDLSVKGVRVLLTESTDPQQLF